VEAGVDGGVAEGLDAHGLAVAEHGQRARGDPAPVHVAARRREELGAVDGPGHARQRTLPAPVLTPRQDPHPEGHVGQLRSTEARSFVHDAVRTSDGAGGKTT
jgi:hypothetical protein